MRRRKIRERARAAAFRAVKIDPACQMGWKLLAAAHFFSRDYAAAKQKRSGKEKEDVRSLEIPGAGHFDVLDPRSLAWRTVEETVLAAAG